MSEETNQRQNDDVVHVLIVDDDEDDFIIARDLLADLDKPKYQVDWADRSERAFDAVDSHAYDVFLIDYRLGEESGLDVVTKLIELGCEVPLVLLTGQADHETDLSAMKAGAADYLVKGQVTGPLLERTIRYAMERKRIEKDLVALSDFDVLTGLANRGQFERRLREAILNADRTGRELAVLFMDMDHFKQINDTLGHGVGDRFLKSVADKLLQCGRKTDTIARWGGDEFAIIATHLGSIGDVSFLARRIIEAMAQPVEIDGHVIHSGASIGITVYPDDAHDAETLLTNADMALYRAKDKGRGNAQFFDAEINAIIQQRKELEIALRNAVANEEFLLHFQPQFDLGGDAVVGAEALVRWDRPDHDLIQPDDFIAAAEASRLMNKIGAWVLRAACRACIDWNDGGGPAMRVAVNISSLQFRWPDLHTLVAEVLEETGINPAYLELDVSEETIMQDVGAAIPILTRLGELGVRLAIDDFGEGVTSLRHLKQFPVSKLKIGCSLIEGMLDDENDRALVRSIISLGHALDLAIAAESVEQDEQLRLLREMGCDEIQGFVFSAAVPEPEFRKLFSAPAEPSAAPPARAATA